MTKPSPPRPLFVYSTLRALLLLAWALTGDATKTTAVATLAHPATVHGYARYTVRHRDYPAARKKLDDFEGEVYAPKPVLVTLEDGSTADADMYV
ncbi:uncharacterized protein FTOL_09453 [Fusarium torulosum]|uniref:Uncharacterized protein n=1 Tax=Fusarium torulosum TaxID=33205 RepID=A0AAE8MH29_9HYPO|nr:uncharacterized protein FTOL_09453 [Fusarium torulosum]